RNEDDAHGSFPAVGVLGERTRRRGDCLEAGGPAKGVRDGYEYRVPSTPYRVSSTPYSVHSAHYLALAARYCVLGTRYSSRLPGRQQRRVQPVVPDGAQHLDELVEILWLLDVGVGAGGVEVADVLGALRRGEDHDRHRAERLRGAQALQHFAAGQARQVEVEQDEVRQAPGGVAGVAPLAQQVIHRLLAVAH